VLWYADVLARYQAINIPPRCRHARGEAEGSQKTVHLIRMVALSDHDGLSAVRRAWNDNGKCPAPPPQTMLEQPPKSAIVGFHQDELGNWVTELQCGHNQHVRHNPPWCERPWVLTSEGRRSYLGFELRCQKCLRNEPSDNPQSE
jgi:hypothetical protein